MAAQTLTKPKGSERSFQRVREIIEECGTQQSALIPILQKIQGEFRYLPQEILAFVATALDVPPATVYGVATFYAQFSMDPKGKYIVQVCDGTACHVRGNKTIIDALRSRLGLAPGQITTKDMRFTLELVSCLGACGLAPAVVVNGNVYGHMTPERVVSLLNELDTADQKEAN